MKRCPPAFHLKIDFFVGRDGGVVEVMGVGGWVRHGGGSIFQWNADTSTTWSMLGNVAETTCGHGTYDCFSFIAFIGGLGDDVLVSSKMQVFSTVIFFQR